MRFDSCRSFVHCTKTQSMCKYKFTVWKKLWTFYLTPCAFHGNNKKLIQIGMSKISATRCTASLCWVWVWSESWKKPDVWITTHISESFLSQRAERQNHADDGHPFQHAVNGYRNRRQVILITSKNRPFSSFRTTKNRSAGGVIWATFLRRDF